MGQQTYLAIDVGATKTLFAVFSPDGQIIFKQKIATNPDYARFKDDIADQLNGDLAKFNFSHCCIALPGRLDLDKGVGIRFGNLPWQDIPVKADLQGLMPNTRVIFHNDAKLAGLSEAILLHKKYHKVLYITLSTGIGGAVIINDIIPADFAVFEPGAMLFEYEGKEMKWESFASGKALLARYGKLASEIEDENTWKAYAKDLTLGFEDLLATVQPDVVVIGGGVGAHFEKFQKYLETELKQINNPLVPTPPLLKAQRPEEAVIYGCYEYIKQNA
ncbi:MAG TPA: ROK family protein [Candidatus Saccharimonadales bacterium]|nr:ROK family protein [Candidatus Saccharimonadales bacterium]